MGRKLSRKRPDQGNRLRELRLAAGVSQYELADMVGEPQSNISGWELSEKPPRSDVLPRLAKALGVSVDTILDTTPIKMRRGGPDGKLQKVLTQASKLPRHQQKKIVEVVEIYVDRFSRE